MEWFLHIWSSPIKTDQSEWIYFDRSLKREIYVLQQQVFTKYTLSIADICTNEKCQKIIQTCLLLQQSCHWTQFISNMPMGLLSTSSLSNIKGTVHCFSLTPQNAFESVVIENISGPCTVHGQETEKCWCTRVKAGFWNPKRKKTWAFESIMLLWELCRTYDQKGVRHAKNENLKINCLST